MRFVITGRDTGRMREGGLLFRLEGAVGLTGCGGRTLDNQHPVPRGPALFLQVHLAHGHTREDILNPFIPALKVTS